MRELTTAIGRLGVAFALPLLTVCATEGLRWFWPSLSSYVAVPDLLLVFGATVAGFVILARRLPFWRGAVLALLYFPVVYVAVLYLAAFIGGRFYGTSF